MDVLALCRKAIVVLLRTGESSTLSISSSVSPYVFSVYIHNTVLNIFTKMFAFAIFVHDYCRKLKVFVPITYYYI